MPRLPEAWALFGWAAASSRAFNMAFFTSESRPSTGRTGRGGTDFEHDNSNSATRITNANPRVIQNIAMISCPAMMYRNGFWVLPGLVVLLVALSACRTSSPDKSTLFEDVSKQVGIDF